MTTWTDFLENPSAERVYLVRLGIAHDNGSSIDTKTLYLATYPKEFTHNYYPCVAGVPRLNRSLQDILTGWSMPSWGTLTLWREDGYALTPDGVVDFDDLVSGNWECAGRSIEILFGGDDLPEGDYQTIMKGTVDKIEKWDNEKIEISILDLQGQLQKKEVALNTINTTTDIEGITSVAAPVFTWKNHSLFVGKIIWIQAITQADWTALNDTSWTVATVPDAHTFTLTGAPDASGFAAYDPDADPGEHIRDYYAGAAESIIGKRKPFAIGDCKNIKPVLVDKTARKYLVHDTDIADLSDIVTVYAKGVSVAFTKQLSAGTFTLNATQTGTITCDVQGFKYDSAYVEHIGDVAEGLLVTCGGISAGDIIAADITAINTAFPYDLWAYVTGEDSVLSVLDRLAGGLPLWHGFNREAEFEIKEFVVPSGTPDLALDTRSIHLGLTGISSGEVVHKIIVKYDENPSKMSANSIGSVTDDHKAWIEEKWREEASEDLAVLDMYPLADSREFETALRDRADAVATGEKWLTLMLTKRFEISFLVKSPALACHLGDVLKITFPRFGLSAGVLHRVIRLEENYNLNEYIITAWR